MSKKKNPIDPIPQGQVCRVEIDRVRVKFVRRRHLESLIRASLKEAIRVHGPITLNLIESASKRITGNVIGVLKQDIEFL